MFDQEPGRSGGQRGTSNAHAGPAPGKQSRVEQELGHGAEPVASASRAEVDGPPVAFSAKQTAEFDQGEVHISETVDVTVVRGEHPITFTLSKDGLNVGNEKIDVDLKSANAVTGKGLKVSGASVSVAHNSTTHTKAKIEDGRVGAEWETTWTVTGKGKHPFEAIFTISAFVGVKPPPQHHHWWQDIPLVGGVLAAAIAAVAGAASAIEDSAPEWGPVVVVVVAA